MKRVTVLLTGCVAVLLAGAIVWAADAPAQARAAKVNLHRYLIESPHSAEECIAVLDDLSGKGAKELSRWDFGCAWGNHTGYAFVLAKDEAAAQALVPAEVRGKARVYPLGKITQEQIKKFHEKM